MTYIIHAFGATRCAGLIELMGKNREAAIMYKP